MHESLRARVTEGACDVVKEIAIISTHSAPALSITKLGYTHKSRTMIRVAAMIKQKERSGGHAVKQNAIFGRRNPCMLAEEYN